MKTTFRRQMTVTLCLLLAATLLIGLTFWGLYTRTAAEQKESSLRSTANSVAELVRAYSGAYYDSWAFRTYLSVAAEASENDILLCDAEGTVQLCTQEFQGCEHVGKSLGTELNAQLLRGKTLRVSAVASVIYGQARLAVAVPVLAEDSSLLCSVVVSIEKETLSAITAKTLRIFVLTSLLVLLVALLAAPLLTRRETRPIQEMAAAARQIAHGNLDVRVPTDHRSEEMEELAVAFNNMTLALKNSDTVRQEFVANVSHELKTPMTTIAGYIDGILDGTIPPEKQRYYMELVSTEVRRLSRLVRNMLEISRLRDQGIPPEKMSDFDVCEEAGQALLCFEQRINQKQLNVEIDMPELGLSVHAMRDAVTQVLQNLIDNAVKFVDVGGTLAIRVRRQGASAVVSVSNTGPTIPPEELPLLFDRFHKTDKSRSADRDGVGLGLYIVKTMILAHGEDVYVTSRDGVTEFTFTLRIAK